jgi:hypothetical protein
LFIACGGKAERNGEGAAGSARDASAGTSSSSGGSAALPEPGAACFALPSTLDRAELEGRIATRLEVALPTGAPEISAGSGLVRAAQLVDRLESALLDPPRATGVARELLRGFIKHQLLDNPHVAGERVPLPAGLSDSVAADMEGEFERVTNLWLIGGQARLGWLFTDNRAFANPELAAHYGIAHSAHADFEAIPQPAPERAGILTLGAFLTRYPSAPSRGVHLAEALACQVVPPPPPIFDSVWTEPQTKSAKDTVVASYADDQVVCKTCHQLYVGYAVALDRYDTLGRYRETLANAPIDTSYYLAAPNSDGRATVEFANPLELGSAIASMPAVRACFVQKLEEYLGASALTDAELSCVLQDFDRRSSNLWSLLAILSPKFLSEP